MTRTSIALLALVALLVTAPVIGLVEAQSAETTTNATSNATASGDDLTLDDLTDTGPRMSNSPPSVRMGEDQFFWVVYWPANNPFADVGSSDSGEYLPPGHTVGRNAVYLRTWVYENQQETVHVAYWERDQKVVQQENTTTTVPVARNVTHVTHNVTFERGRPTVKVPLRQHDDEVRVTMWIEGKEYARWANFGHRSIATTQSVDIDSAGDYLSSVIVDFLVWILIGGFAVGWACKRALDEAGIGPQYGYGPWFLALSILTGLGGLLFYENLANLVVNAQYVLALYVVAVIGIVMLETYTRNISAALFLRPTLEHAESPTGDDAYDVVDAEAREEKIVRTNHGVSVVKPGLFPFLARVFGKSARLANVDQLRTRVPMQDDSKWDELYLVDPESAKLLYYEPEGWRLDWPPLDREHAGEWLAIAGAITLAVASVALGVAGFLTVATVTSVGLLVWAAHPVDGKAAVKPAPVHLRSAFGTMVKYAEDVDDAKHLSEVKEQLDRERVRKQRDVDEKVSDHDRTLVEEILDPDEEVPAAMRDGDGDDEDLTESRRENPPATADGGDSDV
ncbi:hypothetical protein IL252_11155 [Halomicrobium sp. IBSBa]|uniref:hypothetical protein n=1 Tax=Halomicrobium sp. IBSBa TaxID=2778916 RepID=UPI001ABF239E|nr:hypothetical protein [Halomicrobium sp. IBSBa]MBO4248371.1 hypothetical protein [Halomicrobium sp. IBSBa]